MALDITSPGTPEQRTTDGVFGTSGASTVVFFLSSLGGTTVFHDAAGATNAVITLGDGQFMNFEKGAIFNNGLYADVTTATASAVYNQ